MHRTAKRWVRYFVSLALALGILAWLLARQKWDRLEGNVRWGYLLAAIGVAALYWTLRVVRWRWMVSLEGQHITWPQAWVSMLAGLGVGLITPMRSGELARAIFIPKGARLRLAGWVAIEKMFDLSSVLVMCVVGVFYMVFGGSLKLFGAEAVPPWMLLVVPPLLAAALGVPLLVHYRPKRLWSALGRVLPARARSLAEARLEWDQFGIFFAYSMAAELLSILAVFLCLRAYGDIHLLAATMLTPFVMLNNLLPATPGGFGVRELFAAKIFGAFNFTEAMVLAAYVTNALIVLVIPGALGVAGAWVAGVTSQIRSAAAEEIAGEAPAAEGAGS